MLFRTQSKIATALLYGVVNPAVILFASATIVGLLDCALVVGCKYGIYAAGMLEPLPSEGAVFLMTWDHGSTDT